MRDWQKRYRAEHKEERKAYINAWHEKKRTERRQAREAKRAEREAAKNARRAAWEEKCRLVKEKYGFDLGAVPMNMSPEEAEARKQYERDRNREYRTAHHEQRLANQRAFKERQRLKRERRKRSIANLAKAREKQRELKRQREAEVKAAKERELEAKREAFAVKQKAVFEKYGFMLGKTPITPEEKAGKERYIADQQREYWDANRERLNERCKERKRRKAEQRARLVALNAERAAKAAEERRKAKEAERLEARRERENAAIALVEAENAAVAAFATEREANRAAYLAAKMVKKEKTVVLDTLFTGLTGLGAEAQDEPVSQTAAVPSVPEVPEVPSFASIGNEPPKEPPTIITGGEPPTDDEESPSDNDLSSSPNSNPVNPVNDVSKNTSLNDEVSRREAEFRQKHLAQIRKAAAKKRKATIARKKREAAAQAAREAKAAERAAQLQARKEAAQAAAEAKRAAKEAAKQAEIERKALFKQGRKQFKYKIKAYKRKVEKMRRSRIFPKNEADWTPEQHEQLNSYLAQSNAELENWLVERMRKELAPVAKSLKVEHSHQPAEIIAARKAKKAEREKRKREVFEKYGFTLGKMPVTPEEIEGRKRYDRDMEAKSRKRHREQIRAYQKEYAKVRRERYLAKVQAKWTPAQWAEWQKRQDAKERGTPAWLVKEVVKHLAAEQNLTADQITARLLELGGFDFLIAGAESMGAQRCQSKHTIAAAARALALFLDPDNAEMFGEREEGWGMRDEA